MKIHQLLNIQGFEHIHDAPNSVDLVEAKMREKLKLPSHASIEMIQEKYKQLSQAPEYKELFEAYKQFTCLINVTKRIPVIQTPEQDKSANMVVKRVANTAKECYWDLISKACCENDLKSLIDGLAKSPSYTFKHYFKFNEKFTTGLKEAIRHNNSEMINVIIKHDKEAITKLYAGKKYKVQMCIVPELFACDISTLNTFFNHLSLINNLKASGTQTAKLTMFKAVIHYFLSLNKEEQSNKKQRCIILIKALELHQSACLRDKAAEILNSESKENSSFVKEVSSLLDANLVYAQSMANMKNVAPNVLVPSVSYDEEEQINFVFGQSNTDFWQNKMNSQSNQNDQDEQGFEIIDLDSDNEPPVKKAKTDFWKPKTAPLEPIVEFENLNSQEQQEQINALKFLMEIQKKSPFL